MRKLSAVVLSHLCRASQIGWDTPFPRSGAFGRLSHVELHLRSPWCARVTFEASIMLPAASFLSKMLVLLFEILGLRKPLQPAQNPSDQPCGQLDGRRNPYASHDPEHVFSASPPRGREDAERNCTQHSQHRRNEDGRAAGTGVDTANHQNGEGERKHPS
ncbi:uncharacterized protein F5Z01DRAFT_201161 [Emericellopsis atlantica]|uniref:Uncharacterized protein n=1 Tax=Emericellopsis atlantica TaxID=2614577 RepID=A0A9P7ZUE0_9HYPO|nr:uncharacterized protein F5Z01DRAFT_201161 [Emericellopsis atlantica]KAG9258529.1 hypothetical protein F5Z01DRAFT_201161 [Emericellopsis atlantica]